MDPSTIYHQVGEHFSSTSRLATGVKHGEAVARSFDYAADELATISQKADLSLSCGIANLREGGQYHGYHSFASSNA